MDMTEFDLLRQFELTEEINEYMQRLQLDDEGSDLSPSISSLSSLGTSASPQLISYRRNLPHST